jgi:hypothetical protein
LGVNREVCCARTTYWQRVTALFLGKFEAWVIFIGRLLILLGLHLLATVFLFATIFLSGLLVELAVKCRLLDQ